MPNNTEVKKTRTKPLYRLARWIANLLQFLIYPIKYHGLEKIENLQRPFLLIANHRSWYDPLSIAVPFRHFPIHYLGKKELASKNKFFAKLFDGLYMIPVARKEADIGAIKRALKVLKQGEVLGIFPEGTRHRGGDMQNPEGGISLLAFMSKVPVIPAYIDKAFRPFRRVNIYFMDPLPYEDLMLPGAGGNANEIFMERLKKRYRDIVKMH